MLPSSLTITVLPEAPPPEAETVTEPVPLPETDIFVPATIVVTIPVNDLPSIAGREPVNWGDCNDVRPAPEPLKLEAVTIPVTSISPPVTVATPDTKVEPSPKREYNSLKFALIALAPANRLLPSPAFGAEPVFIPTFDIIETLGLKYLEDYYVS